MALSIATLASAYALTSDGVPCYEWPDNRTAVEFEYKTRQDVTVLCLETGTANNGSWALTKETDCYIPVFFLNINDNVEVCNDEFPEEEEDGEGSIDDYSPESLDNSLVNRADNYPYKSKCGDADPWNFIRCQCTSFAAFRVNKVLGVKFHNYYKGPHWGMANNWDSAAKKASVTINNKPRKKSVGQTDAGSGGHVVWITKVSKNKKKVSLEEYNYNNVKAYGTRTVAASKFKYIHFK